MKKSKNKKTNNFFIGLIIVLTLLAIYFIVNIKVVPDDAHVCTSEEKAAQICTMEYNPVCGSDNLTYGNGCMACSNDIDYYVMGEC